MTKPARIILTLDRADALRVARLLWRKSKKLETKAARVRSRWDADAAGHQLDQISKRFWDLGQQLYDKLAPKEGK